MRHLALDPALTAKLDVFAVRRVLHAPLMSRMDSVKKARRSRAGVRNAAVRLHRWLSIAVAIFWLAQAVTGLTSLFHWELDDAAVSLAHAPTDLEKLEARLAALAPPGSGRYVSSVWTTAGLADRYSITVVDETSGNYTSIRVAGDGTVLQTLEPGERSFFGTVVLFHHNLLLGDTGSWIVGFSGILLITNLFLGLRAAWPARGQWKAALNPFRRGARAARLFQLHRAFGLALVFPAIVLMSAGTSLVFQEGLGSLIGAKAPSLDPLPWRSGPQIGFAGAARSALATADRSRLTMVELPTPEDATYRVRILMPGEIRRAYGTSVVLVAAQSGDVRGIFPASEAEPAKAFMDALYAVHTGEALGTLGRLINLAVALWLITMIVLGLMLWHERRRQRRRQAHSASAASEPEKSPQRESGARKSPSEIEAP